MKYGAGIAYLVRAGRSGLQSFLSSIPAQAGSEGHTASHLMSTGDLDRE